jgi:hypothetical protein
MRDKCYQAYLQWTVGIKEQLEHARVLVSQNCKWANSGPVSDSDLTTGILSLLEFDVKTLLKFMNLLPGIAECASASKNVRKMVRENVYMLFTLKRHRLYLNDEFYCFLPNGMHYTVSMTAKVLSNDLAREHFECYARFQEIQMTEAECALLAGFMLIISFGDTQEKGMGFLYKLNSKIVSCT